MRFNRSTALILVALTALLLVVFLGGCGSKSETKTDVSRGGKLTVPKADKFGVIEAKSWASQFPNQYKTFQENLKNKWPEGKADLLEEYPEMVVLGKGYGYATFFMEAGGHPYSLYTITHNGRVSAKTKTGCIACKTAQFNMDVEKEGSKIWKESFWPVVRKYTEGITCANCHENTDPRKLKITRSQWITALGDEIDNNTLSGEVCGQCHCDYSMDPKTSEPTSPYDGVSTMTPDQAIKWYDKNNYVDWEYPVTGAKMIAVRHSEYEYNYGGKGNIMTNMGYNCADCHMPRTKSKDGGSYMSHYWESPLVNEDLMKNNCNRCHKDIKAEVRAIQERIDGRTQDIGQRAADFVHNFEAAVKNGSLSTSELNRLRTIQREAVFFWNSAMAENSEGAHNTALYTDVLDRAEKLLNEGDKILGKKSTVAGFQAWKKKQGDIFHSTIPASAKDPYEN